MDLAKFEQKMKKGTMIDPITQCWLYNGHKTNSGHCQIMVDKSLQYVHRISAAIYLNYDLSDEVYQVNHKNICPNPNCWNPDHLYIGTSHDNVFDSIIKGTHNTSMNALKTHCKNEHEFTLENTIIDKRDGSRSCKRCRYDRQNEKRRMYGR